MSTTALGRTSRAGVSLAGSEVRTYTALHLRAVTADGSEDAADGPFTVLEGQAVPYETWYDSGWFIEKMRKGVFRKSIREAASRLPLLLWHDNHTFPIGVSTKWTETDGGLLGLWGLDPDDEQAQTAADKANKQMLTGMSVGFAEVTRPGAWVRVDVEDPSETPLDSDAWWSLPRERRGEIWNEARLLEVSLTPTPAYAGAQVSLVRSSQPVSRAADSGRPRRAMLEHWQRNLEALRR